MLIYMIHIHLKLVAFDQYMVLTVASLKILVVGNKC